MKPSLSAQPPATTAFRPSIVATLQQLKEKIMTKTATKVINEYEDRSCNIDEKNRQNAYKKLTNWKEKPLQQQTSVSNILKTL